MTSTFGIDSVGIRIGPTLVRSSVLLHTKTFNVASLLPDIGGAHFAIKIILPSLPALALSPDILLLRPHGSIFCDEVACRRLISLGLLEHLAPFSC